jgi:hypothetical protein
MAVLEVVGAAVREGVSTADGDAVGAGERVSPALPLGELVEGADAELVAVAALEALLVSVLAGLGDTAAVTLEVLVERAVVEVEAIAEAVSLCVAVDVRLARAVPEGDPVPEGEPVLVAERVALREAVREGVREGVGRTQVTASSSRLGTPGQGSPKTSSVALTLQEALPTQACETTSSELAAWQKSQIVNCEGSQ